MATATSNAHISQEILRQLGGNKFLAMTGSKNLLYSSEDPNWLSMHLTRNKSGAKYLKITLNAMDTYDMVFTKVKKTLNKENSFGSFRSYDEELIVVEEHKGVYDDMLQALFTKTTGLYTKL